MRKHAPGKRPPHIRRGTNLLEMVVVTSLSTLLIGLATVGIHHLLQAHGNLRDASRNGLIQQRLTVLFRKDCRASIRASAVENGIQFTKPDAATVTYTVEDNVVFRKWTDGSNDGRDRFYSTRNWQCELKLSENVAELRLSQTLGGSQRTLPGTPRLQVVRSQIGSHQMLVTSLASAPEKTEEDKQ